MAKRGMTAAYETELDKQKQYHAFLVEIQFSTTLRYTTWHHDLSWNSQTWLSTGNILKIPSSKEQLDMRVGKIKIDLSAVDQSLLTVLLTEVYHNKKLIIYSAMVASSAVVTNPVNVFDGLIDSYEYDDESSIISIAVSNHLAKFNRVSGRILTFAHQLDLFPGDTSLEFIGRGDKKVKWGTMRV